MEENTTFRIYGEVLGESNTVIDCDLDKSNSDILNRSVCLVEVNGDRTWDISLTELENAEKDHSAVRHSNMSHPAHNVWGRLEGLREDINTEPFKQNERLSGDTLDLFKLVVREMKNDSGT